MVIPLYRVGWEPLENLQEETIGLTVRSHSVNEALIKVDSHATSALAFQICRPILENADVKCEDNYLLS